MYICTHISFYIMHVYITLISIFNAVIAAKSFLGRVYVRKNFNLA